MVGQTIAAEIKAHSASIGAKIEAQTTRLDALAGSVAAQHSRLRMLMWMIGAAVAVTGILIRLWG